MRWKISRRVCRSESAVSMYVRVLQVHDIDLLRVDFTVSSLYSTPTSS